MENKISNKLLALGFALVGSAMFIYGAKEESLTGLVVGAGTVYASKKYLEHTAAEEKYFKERKIK
jgi:hypothetical protein